MIKNKEPQSQKSSKYRAKTQFITQKYIYERNNNHKRSDSPHKKT